MDGNVSRCRDATLRQGLEDDGGVQASQSGSAVIRPGVNAAESELGCFPHRLDRKDLLKQSSSSSEHFIETLKNLLIKMVSIVSATFMSVTKKNKPIIFDSFLG